MKRKYVEVGCKSLLVLLLIFVLTGCRKSPQKPNKSQDNGVKKLPQILVELEEGILKAMFDLDSVAGIEGAIREQKEIKTKEDQVKTQAKQEDDDKKDNKPEESEGENKEDQEESIDIQNLIKENEIIISLLQASDIKGSFEESPKVPENIDQVWEKINNNIEGIHRKWNSLEVELQSATVAKSKTEDFEDGLNRLSLSAQGRQVFNSLQLANELSRATAQFRSYFEGSTHHEVYSMYYYLRSVILSAAIDDYDRALDQLEETKKIGDSLRQDLIKNDSMDIVQKFELSIEDLRKQLEDQNFYLSQIKAGLVAKNIKLMEDDLQFQ